jgi:hypothetical protein
MRMVVAGPANVLPMVWSRRSAEREPQIMGPVFSDGAGVVEGRRERYGARRYTSGKQ